ncbi:hypothetical protein SAMN05444156_2828 [Verrucomicrobium sp. GAS474]|uniref:hypothetical protein n=1 Tax=Verrucomicrobium sp. GAS474 TaxID=1882831 RepID=UPI00087ADB41|nr:hypothetical protein [Verrucomicrobium sp. GAS474]SDU24519.1 hypothetical protein SAMN05444156_2828 [Verrucomicrobium sp. GAS474]
MNSQSGKATPEILLVLAIIALACFVGVQKFLLDKKFLAVQEKIDGVKKDGEDNVSKLSANLNSRYLQLLKLSEEIAMQQGRFVTIERSLAAERESMSTLQDDFKRDLDAVRKKDGEHAAAVATLEDKFKNEIAAKERSIGQLQTEYDGLKNLMDDQSALLVMVREQSILNSAGGGAGAGGAGGNGAAGSATPQPIDVFPTPATPQSPDSVAGSSLVPIPSGSSPSTPQPAPVPVHDAGPNMK